MNANVWEVRKSCPVLLSTPPFIQCTKRFESMKGLTAAGQLSSQTLLLRSHAAVRDAICGLVWI